MAGRLVIELLDAFAEVGLDHLDVALFEIRPHIAFLGQHRFAFDQSLRAMRGEDVIDDLIVLTGIARPMHMRAVFPGLSFELLEIFVEMRKRVLLDRRCEIAELLPFRDPVRLAVAFHPEIPQAPIVELEMRLGLDEMRRRLSVINRPHARLPLSIWAIWMKRRSRPRRAAQPFWCMRHDISAETIYSA